MTEEKANDEFTLKCDEVTLKWGTLKGWHTESDAYRNLLQRFALTGASASAMLQNDTNEQKQILIEIVSLPNMKIFLDWEGKYITKDEAIKYLTEYGKETP